mgnify:CR=1 FL=1
MAFSIVLISFREWLHSYGEAMDKQQLLKLIQFSSLSESGFIPTRRSIWGSMKLWSSVLISFREWLHSYRYYKGHRSRVSQEVLISFREWLHSYPVAQRQSESFSVISSHLFQRVASFLHRFARGCFWPFRFSSHLFQRVASFLRFGYRTDDSRWSSKFSSLSESGFIPTKGTFQ